MSVHRDLMAGAQSLHAAMFGDSRLALYEPPANTTNTEKVYLRHARIGGERRTRQVRGDRITFAMMRELTVITDANSPQFCGVTDPRPNGTITIGDTVYTVVDTQQGGIDNELVVHLMRATVSEFYRENELE